MIHDLKGALDGDLRRLGGKAASLVELHRAGVEVPPGFVIDAQAYRLAAAPLRAVISAALAAPGVAEGAPGSCEAAAAAIRAHFEALPLGEVEAPLRARVAKLGAVAVRSSATAEDLPDASFAGQQETFLGVRGADEVVAAVRRCWASLWTARAISYRARQGYDDAEVALAVVIQEMVEPEVAGVLFTRNPVNGRDDELLLTASWGLGEAVVSGMVTPDTWRLGRTGALVREARLGTKERRVASHATQGTLVEAVPAEQRAVPCLERSQLEALRSLGVRVEAWYGSPRDIEFAWAGGRAVLLQARPITTTTAPPPPRLGRSQRRTLDDLLEHYPTPPFPLDEAAVVDGYEALQETLREAGLALPHAREVLRMDGEGVYRLSPPPLRLSLRVFGLARAAWRAWSRDPDAWAPQVAAGRADLRASPAAGLDDLALAVRLTSANALAGTIARARFRDAVIPGALRGLWLSALSRLARRPVDPFAWLGGLAYKTAQIEGALHSLAELICADAQCRVLFEGEPPANLRATLAASEHGRGVLAAIDAFLDDHGARTARAYVPFATRSWREDERSLYAVLSAVVRGGAHQTARQRAASAVVTFEATRADVRARLPSFLRGTFDRTLEAYRRAHAAREATLYAIEEAFVAAREAGDEAGRRLAARGALAAPGHVVFARLEEVVAALAGEAGELRQVVSRRRARREVAASTWRSHRLTPASTGASLEGLAGSPGLASGPVRVILDVPDFGKLQPGDVLVCPHTDPTWTPLFGLAVAVVADTGGPLSHAAIVAREYGIPAVLGTASGTTTLRDGESVIVDGLAGQVRRTAEGRQLP